MAAAAADEFSYVVVDDNEVLIRVRTGIGVDLVGAITRAKRALGWSQRKSRQTLSVARVEANDGKDYTELRIRVTASGDDGLEAVRFYRESSR